MIIKFLKNWTYKERKYVMNEQKEEGNKYIDYLADEIKPFIDANFYTLKEKEFTGIGGSSMGGIAAFNFATKRNDIFGFSLCFSPAFHLYEKKDLYEYIDSLNINPHDYGKFFFYTGAVEFESLFLEPTKEMYQYFVSKGFNKDQVGLRIDKTQKHCEAAWNKHFAEGMKFWLKDL